ncbi:MAG: hypothetical protein JXB47_07280, partial [Anaerolineae bacterium]|nr:hypothetical protein [Anaerolineae bacterium]
MKLFRRKPSEEAADLPVEDAPPAEAGTEPGPEPDEKRPWFRRRKQTDREIAAPDLSPGAPAPAAPEPT